MSARTTASGATAIRRTTCAAPPARWTWPTARCLWNPGWCPAGASRSWTTPAPWCSTDDGWVAPRDGSRTDLYFFGFGLDHRDAIKAFYAVSGPTPVLPRFALGNWWSRYHRYTADEYVELISQVRRRGHPVLGQRARHGLAPGRCRSAVRQRLDRLQLEHRAVPGSGRVPAVVARQGSAGDLERAPGRWRPSLRGRLPADGQGSGSGSGSRAIRLPSTSPIPSSSPPISRSCTARWSGPASTSGGSTGSRARTPGWPGSIRCGC